MIQLWIPDVNNPGVKHEHVLCTHTGILYRVPGFSETGHMEDLIPSAAQIFTEAFGIRDERIRNDGQFFKLKTEKKKNAPGSTKFANFELAFPLTRSQRVKFGVENPGDLLVVLRNTQSGDVQAFMPPMEKVRDMNWHDRTKVDGIQSWRDQIFGRHLPSVRFDRKESKMWTVHEHYGLLVYVVRNAIAFCVSKGVVLDSVLDRLNWTAIAQWIRENFSPQILGPKPIMFAIYDIDTANKAEGFAQRKTLRSDRLTFDFTEEEIKHRVQQDDIFAAIMKTEVDEYALEDEAQWVPFLISEPEIGTKGKSAKFKPADKVTTGRVVKRKPKAQSFAAKGKDRAKAATIEFEAEETDTVVDTDGDSGGASTAPSTPPRSITAPTTRSSGRK